MFHQMKLNEIESFPSYRDRATTTSTTKGMDKRFKEIE